MAAGSLLPEFSGYIYWGERRVVAVRARAGPL